MHKFCAKILTAFIMDKIKEKNGEKNLLKKKIQN